MPKDKFNYEKWVREQTTRSSRSKTLYDYFDFARQLNSTEPITNLTYKRALDLAEKNNKYHLNFIAKARKHMTQTANVSSKFGLAYNEYWQDVSGNSIQKNDASGSRLEEIKTGAAERMASIAADTMVSISEDIGHRARSRPHITVNQSSPPVQLSSSPTLSLPESLSSSPTSSSSRVSPNDAPDMHSIPTTSSSLCKSLDHLMRIISQLGISLKDFNIIDFTEAAVRDLFQESLSDDIMLKLNQPVDKTWKPDTYCTKILNDIADADPDQHDIIIAVRTCTLKPDEFRPYKHRDLRAIETISGAWLDLITSPLNPILCQHGERTSAIYGVIPIINALFLQYNEKVNVEWIEIEANTTKRHKWDGLMYTSQQPKTTIMMIECAGGFAHEKMTKNTSDTQKLYRNALRVINADSPSASATYPRIFTVLTINNRILFEVLTQVDNGVYVRKRSAETVLPTSCSTFQTAVSTLPSVFSWRDAVIEYVTTLPMNHQTKNAYDTVSPLSSQ